MVTFPHAASRGAARLLLGTTLLLAAACGGGGDTPTQVDPSAVTLTGAPDLLTTGASATLTGTNFSGTPSSNSVTIDGVAATVTSASATQLVVTVPALPCAATHAAVVSVTTAGKSATLTRQLRTATVAPTATYTQLLLSPAEAGCTELPSGTGTYLVSVVNTSKASGLDQSGTGLSFRIAGTPSTGSSATLLAAGTSLQQAVETPVVTGPADAAALLFGGAAARRAERLHDDILESNRAAYERLHAAGSLVRGGASRSLVPSGRSAAALPAIGETRKFRVAQFSTALGATGSCSNFVEVTARAVYVGTRSVVYEDVAAPLAGTMDSYFRSVGQEFDQSMYVVDSTYFGDPLVTDASTDNDKHLSMVFTPSMTEGVAGFVTSCDFFPRDSSGTANDDRESNFGEYFYAIVPTVAGTGFSGNTPDQWLRVMRHTIVHEVKHIASFGARLTNGANTFEESWLEEGTARHSEELWLRRSVYSVAWKANTGYGSATAPNSLYCDVRPSFPECAGKPYGMYNHFGTLYNVLDKPGTYSMFGRVADGDFNFYATAWSFVRYAIDRYATLEAAFLRGLTQSTTSAGLPSIASLTGESAPAMLANWSLAMYLDDQGTNPDLNVATWNFHDIFGGMNRDFGTSSYPKPYPLVPAAVSTTFSVDNAGIKSGGFAMYRIPATATGSNLVKLSALSGSGSAPSALRMVVVKIP